MTKIYNRLKRITCILLQRGCLMNNSEMETQKSVRQKVGVEDLTWRLLIFFNTLHSFVCPAQSSSPSLSTDSAAIWQRSDTDHIGWSGRTVLHLVVVRPLFCCVAFRFGAIGPTAQRKGEFIQTLNQRVVPGRLPTEVSSRAHPPRRQGFTTQQIGSFMQAKQKQRKTAERLFADYKYTICHVRGLHSAGDAYSLKIFHFLSTKLCFHT